MAAASAAIFFGYGLR